MALKKQHLTRYGIAVEYWRIEEAAFRTEGFVLVRLSGYPSEIIRREYAEPLETMSITIPYSATESISDSIFGYLYNEIKQDEFFADAEDLL